MDIEMVNDIFLFAKEKFLNTYRGMNEDSFEQEKNDILNKLFTKEEITEYNQFIINDLHDEAVCFCSDLIPIITTKSEDL